MVENEQSRLTAPLSELKCLILTDVLWVRVVDDDVDVGLTAAETTVRRRDNISTILNWSLLNGTHTSLLHWEYFVIKLQKLKQSVNYKYTNLNSTQCLTASRHCSFISSTRKCPMISVVVLGTCTCTCTGTCTWWHGTCYKTANDYLVIKVTTTRSATAKRSHVSSRRPCKTFSPISSLIIMQNLVLLSHKVCRFIVEVPKILDYPRPSRWGRG